MQDRRTFLQATMAALFPAATGTQVQAPTPGVPVELARHALSGPLAGFEAVLVDLNNGPSTGRAGVAHRHPGPVLAYVLEGEMRFAIDNQPAQVVPAGRTFFEPTGALHSSSGSASTSAGTRALVFMVVPTGAALTVPA